MPSTSASDARVCVGQIGAPHGVRGLVSVAAFTDMPENLTAYGPVETEGGRALSLTIKGSKKGALLVAIEGVATREAAAALRGERLYVGRERLPEADDEEWYHADLVGLVAEGPGGAPLGTVISVHDFGAGDLIEVDPGEGATVYVPFTREIVPVTDVDGGRIVMDPPTGLFAEAADSEEASGG